MLDMPLSSLDFLKREKKEIKDDLRSQLYAWPWLYADLLFVNLQITSEAKIP